MASFNKVILIGNLSADPELKQTTSGKSVVKSSIAVHRKFSKPGEAKQIARLGNAVCPPVATALIRANCPELCYGKVLITIADLEKALEGE